ncbi:MAG TPA: hypothetical protein VIA06_14475 [Candidatus Dormibacteraeota bacterium]|jgi:hypothetical protein|nr:hypothetical protein [Candidatus Dormibacteraeota bacterium]
MFTKLAIFGLGYMLGARAGRQRYDAIVKEARSLARGEEVSAVVGFVRGAFWILSQRGRSIGKRAPYRPGDD